MSDDGKIVTLSTGQNELAEALRELTEMAESGELMSFAGVGILRSDEVENDINILVFRGGYWGKFVYTLIGAMESVKDWLLLDTDERIQRTIYRISTEL